MDAAKILAEHRAVIDEVGGRLLAPCLKAVDLIAGSLRAGGKLLICGNGGSAADAQHIAAELVNRFLLNRRPYAAIALTTDASILTSVGNDCDYDQIFEKQVQALGRPGDVLLGISTSGNSRNVVRAVDAANALGLHTIGLLGGTGGVLQGKVALPLTVTCTGHTPRVQEGHLLMYHLICERLEEILENKA
ncbi:MAG: SIS domain-containing protein [Kiritimatiellia bacterium]